MRSATRLVVLFNAVNWLEPRPAGKFLARFLRCGPAKSENRRLLPGGVNALKV